MKLQYFQIYLEHTWTLDEPIAVDMIKKHQAPAVEETLLIETLNITLHINPYSSKSDAHTPLI